MGDNAWPKIPLNYKQKGNQGNKKEKLETEF
jgi:hypothetical protein